MLCLAYNDSEALSDCQGGEQNLCSSEVFNHLTDRCVFSPNGQPAGHDF